ncbi:MAG: hypothetical protein VB934_14985 [Polyangiaceae bacterium]
MAIKADKAQTLIGLAVLLIAVIVAWNMHENSNERAARLAQAASASASATGKRATAADEPPKRSPTSEVTGRLGWSRAAVKQRRRAWARKRKAIYDARAKRTAPRVAPTEAEQAEQEAIHKAYPAKIKAALRELVPLLRECYENARQDDAEINGKLVLSYSIGGDDSVGGIVEESEIDVGESDELASNEALVQCVTETIYTIEIEPPPGGLMQVTYPLQFSSADPKKEQNDEAPSRSDHGE